MRNGVQDRSRKAVASAGSRPRGGTVNTAGHWNPMRGNLAVDGLLPSDVVARPGKTKHERRS